MRDTWKFEREESKRQRRRGGRGGVSSHDAMVACLLGACPWKGHRHLTTNHFFVFLSVCISLTFSVLFSRSPFICPYLSWPLFSVSLIFCLWQTFYTVKSYEVTRRKDRTTSLHVTLCCTETSDFAIALYFLTNTYTNNDTHAQPLCKLESSAFCSTGVIAY